MTYFTGDFHGDVWSLNDRFADIKLKEEDIVIILGDAGLNYYDNKKDKERKRILNTNGIEYLCVHGNHEMRPSTIESYHEEKWHNGIVYVEDEYRNLKFAKDGEIYELDGMRYIVIGGAYSVDKYYRLANKYKWFSDEQPDETIKNRVEDVLEKEDWKIDYVLSHTCPSKYVPVEAFLPGLDQKMIDHSTEEWLDTIEDRLSYSKWLCGHWHINKKINNIEFIYNNIITN